MIDDGLPTAWDEAVVEAAARYRQGHLVAAPPFFYGARGDHGVWALTRQAADPDETEELFELAEDDRPPYGLITTQTCDIQEQAPQRQPWIQIAPVYVFEQPTKNDLHLLRRDRISHLVLLDPPDLPDRTWVADLRIEMPLEKSWLVERHPLEAFPTEPDYERLAERLAGVRERPALANVLVDTIARPLRKWLTKKAGRNASQTVRNVRLVLGGTRLKPVVASLLVVSDDVLPKEAHRAWEDWWNEIQGPARVTGLSLLPTKYATLDTITARDWVESVDLNLGYLSRE